MADSDKNPENQAAESPDDSRRGFLTKSVAILSGSLVGLVPLAAGIITFLDPLFRKWYPDWYAEKGKASQAGDYVSVARVDQIPQDGRPERFQVIKDKVDAWNSLPDQRVGAVYVRRLEDGQLQAFNATCPHAGCFVDFNPNNDRFECPCHKSFFQADGTRIVPKDGVCPAPRDLDELPVDQDKSNQTGEVFVEFKNFLAAKHEKIPIE